MLASSRQAFYARLILTFIFLYLMTPLGATFNGVIVPDAHPILFVIMGVSVASWLFIHYRAGWKWHRSAYDLVFFLWLAAFAISLAANMETLRRSLIGLWYMLLYIGIWYALHDMLANGLKRSLLIDAFLTTGIMLVFFSLVQLSNQNEFRAPVSLIGNPNALGAILLALIPFAVVRILTAEFRISRFMWTVYSLLLIGNLLLTFSRGAWGGMFVALAIVAVLWLAHRDLLSMARLRAGWHGLSGQSRRLIMAGLLAIATGFVLAVLLVINSFSIQNRRIELRTRLWDSAIAQFLEKPLTGQGFYSFGHDYPLSIQIPPQQSHAHAHSVPLNIAAEMGLFGLFVFGISLFVAYRVMRQNWMQIELEERPLLIAAIAALAGIGIHHLVDLPAMMPIVALVGMLVLVLVVSPAKAQVITASWRLIGHPLGMTILWLGLLVTAIWSSGVYRQYLDAMRHALQVDYREAVIMLDSVIQQDPMMPIYSQQQAFIYGLIAAQGDESAAQAGIDAYSRFLELEPNHAISWANQAALYYQLGNSESAIASLEHALTLAPDYSIFQRNLKIYQGDDSIREVDVPDYVFNQNFSRFEFLRETVEDAFLPQVGWGLGSS